MRDVSAVEGNCRILRLNRMDRGQCRGRSAAPNSSLSAHVAVKWALATAVVELRDTLVPLSQGHEAYFQAVLPASRGDRPELPGVSVQVTWCLLCVSLLTSRVLDKWPSLCCSGFWPDGAIHILTCCLPSTRLSLVSLTVQSQLRPATASGKALGAEVPGAFSLVHRVAAALPFAIVRVRYTGRCGNSLHSNAGFLRKSPFNHVTAIALCNLPSFRDGTQRFTDPRVGKMSTQSTLGPWRAGESSSTLRELAHLDVSTPSS